MDRKIPFFPIAGGAFQPVNNTASFTAHFTGPDAAPASFTLYSRNDAGPWDEVALTNIAEDLRDAIVASYLPVVSDEWNFDRVVGRDLEDQFPQVVEVTPAGAAPGELVSKSLPVNVAVRATFVGDPGSAPRTGGIALLAPAEAQVDGSLLTLVSQGVLQDAAEALHNAMSAVGPAHVIVSRYSGTHLEGPDSKGRIKLVPTKRLAGVTNTVQSVRLGRRVDTLKKRLPREAA